MRGGIKTYRIQGLPLEIGLIKNLLLNVFEEWLLHVKLVLLKRFFAVIISLLHFFFL